MMAAAADGASFRLSANFPSEESTALKVDKATGGGGGWGSKQEARLGLPKLDFGMRSEVEFPAETISATVMEEEDFFAELTRRLTLSESRNASSLDPRYQGSKLSGGSPQSILGGAGSWSGRSSSHSPPPTTPFETKVDPWRPIFDACGPNARLKPIVADPSRVSLNEANHHVPHLQNVQARYYAEQQMKLNYLAAVRKASNTTLIFKQHIRGLKRYSNCCATLEMSNQLVLPQQGRVPVKACFEGSLLKRKESAGTGVFIPRSYDTTPAPPVPKTAPAPALVPAKVPHALNKSFEELSGRSQLHCSPYAASLSQQTYDALLASRHEVLAQQHRTAARADDITQSNLAARLPQEWSY